MRQLGKTRETAETAAKTHTAAAEDGPPDTDKQARPLSVKSGFITAAVGLTDVPRLPANPSSDTVPQDLVLNLAVP